MGCTLPSCVHTMLFSEQLHRPPIWVQFLMYEDVSWVVSVLESSWVPMLSLDCFLIWPKTYFYLLLFESISFLFISLLVFPLAHVFFSLGFFMGLCLLLDVGVEIGYEFYFIFIHLYWKYKNISIVSWLLASCIEIEICTFIRFAYMILVFRISYRNDFICIWKRRIFCALHIVAFHFLFENKVALGIFFRYSYLLHCRVITSLVERPFPLSNYTH